MSVIFVQIMLGVVILFAGGELLVRGAVSLAKSWKIPTAIIGLTIVAYGTSAPELVVSLQASATGSPDIALGNVIGSNIGNILLILGVTALLVPLAVNRTLIMRDGWFMVGVAGLLWLFCLDQELTRAEGLIMVFLLVAYTWYAYRTASLHLPPEPETDIKITKCSWCAGAYVLIGLALLFTGSDILIDGALALARSLGVSEAVIGLTVIAVGTSIPELATSLIAAYRKQADMSIANIIGSNIFNIIGILGICSIFNPIPVSPKFLEIDLWVLIAVSLGFIVVVGKTGTINKRFGGMLVTLFTAYTLYQYFFTTS